MALKSLFSDTVPADFSADQMLFLPSGDIEVLGLAPDRC